MDLRETSLPGCFELNPRVLADERGSFTKIFQRTLFERSIFNFPPTPTQKSSFALKEKHWTSPSTSVKARPLSENT
jgi:dTDP-4-dehydrorhamnose 3,5-epimerase-like enzyme